MASTSETGHAINISNFKLLIDRCSVIPNYNPSNSDITIPNLTNSWTIGDTAHQNFTTLLQGTKNPINAREILFKPVNEVTTQSLNYFESTKASKQVKKDAKGLADRIRGFNVKIPKLADGSPDPDYVSQSHQSYIQKQDAFKQLLDLYASDPNYAPNEIELNLATLQALNTNMKSSNDNMGVILAPVISARVIRNNKLYEPETGLLDLAEACKDYVIGLVKYKNARPITSIRFRRPKKD